MDPGYFLQFPKTESNYTKRDLSGGNLVSRYGYPSRGEPPVAIPLADLAEGNPRAQRPFERATF